MKKVILFAGSNSSTSINKELINYTASLFTKLEAEVIDLRDYEPAMFGEDLEKERGIHPQIEALVTKINEADAVIMSTPEHNSMPPAFFKNILDWLSRVAKVSGSETQYLENKPTILMSVGPGRGGALKARAQVANMIAHAKADVVGEFSLPEFGANFSQGKITNPVLDAELKELVRKLEV